MNKNNNSEINEIRFKKFTKMWPKDENKAFVLLVILIAFLSIAFAIVFTVSVVGIGFFHGMLTKILLLALFIFFSILVVSISVVKILKKSSTQLQSLEVIMENLFELEASARALKILIPVIFTIVIFLGWESWRTLKSDIIKQIDPEEYTITLEEKKKEYEVLIDSSKIFIDRVRTFIDSARILQIKRFEDYTHKLLPVGTIVGYNGSQTLPDDWAPCDGRKIKINEDSTFITPNLVNRFIIGTTDSTFGGNSPLPINTIGGTSTHSHQYDFSISGSTNLNPRGARAGEVRISENLITNYPVAHLHSFNLNYRGRTQETSFLPPYYSLIFIIKYR